MTVVMPTSVMDSGAATFHIANHTEISSSANPTTISPMTAPARKATLSPSLSDCLTANVVRAEALVAIFMPNQPQVPEKTQANRTPTGVTRLRMPANPRPVRISSRTANTIATTLYWRLRYAIAPARTAEAISIMSSSPSGYAMTFRLSNRADTSAATAATGATNQTHASVTIIDRSASTNTFTLLTSIHDCAARTAQLGNAAFCSYRYSGLDLRVQASASGEVGQAGKPADLP